MAAPISLREDFDGPMLRGLVLSEKARTVTQRLLALVTIYDAGTRSDAARLGGVGLQAVRDWGLRFNAKGPGGSSTGNRPDVLLGLDEPQRRALVALLKAGPIPAIHEVVRWRLIDLAQVCFLGLDFALRAMAVATGVVGLTDESVRVASRKQSYLRTRQLQISAQNAQKLKRQHDVSLFAALSVLDPDDPAAAVAIGDFQVRRFRRSQRCRVGRVSAKRFRSPQRLRES